MVQKNVYTFLIRLVRRAISQGGDPVLESSLGKPPFEDPNIAKGITTSILLHYKALPADTVKKVELWYNDYSDTITELVVQWEQVSTFHLCSLCSAHAEYSDLAPLQHLQVSELGNYFLYYANEFILLPPAKYQEKYPSADMHKYKNIYLRYL